MKRDVNSRERRYKLIGTVGMSVLALLAGVLTPVLERSDGPLPLVLAALLIAGFVCFLVIMIVKGVRIDREKAAARREAGARSGAQPAQLRPGGAALGPGGGDAWKKQLDGFLAAGIIDRSEYRVLLKRRRK